MKSDFIPRSTAELYQYLTAFRSQLVLLPSGFLPAPLKTSLESNIDKIKLATEQAAAAEIAYHAAVEHRKSVTHAELKEFRDSIQTIKHFPAYTDTIGQTLNIIGSTIAPDYSALKPIAKIAKVINGVQIKYTRDIADGVNIFCKRGSETDFTRLEKVTRIEYTDTRANLDGANAETREYYLVYYKNDLPIGVQSDTVTIRV
ncbi:MAG: hypothetical protein RI894_307 [Bacteroidota bacterium]|jgi:hypothetical protein